MRVLGCFQFIQNLFKMHKNLCSRAQELVHETLEPA